ncbi:class I adenylate cyclase [Pseudomonas sp. MS19]|uniref:class I adenylate cyclase n=1 Tax=Pseudomonas sp. MS19 TaxID=2579939 RepID=UPI0015621E9D|nr:class I adenylate cyclase [Pseudomonas sp. MS19]NRH27725.1 class I adenylate cyclase [Pseudomonas sp. MS19]
MTRNQELRPDLDDGIDRKVLSQLRARFMSINQGRLLRALQPLSARQRAVIKLLPLLFDVNHPLLPGYVSGLTPAGLSAYQPDSEALAEAQRLTRSFSYKPLPRMAPRALHGLFLMGSLGTLAQAEQSDMDVWLCHAPDIDEQGLAELRNKARLLEQWAISMGAQLHVFLVDPQRFRQAERDARLTSDDCGTTQHYLLLDEFYRTAIWLAGRTPLWWLVPAFEEHRYDDYTHQLLSKRFVAADEVIDFGHLAHIPPNEFVGAGMWQLFKGIESPYKSALKLLLTEVYASEHPQVECLALRFKRAVYANQLDLNELDPYLVVYRRLEEYLSTSQSSERLEMVRRCLYLKVNRMLSRPPRNRQKSWQRVLLEKLCREWQWDERQLRLLDSRSQWKLRQVSNERRMLINELTYSYRFLQKFAADLKISTSTSKRDLALLGRRLYAAFERRPGKIEFFNPGIAPDLGEDALTLVQHAQSDTAEPTQWALYSGNLVASEISNFAPLKRTSNLIALLTWCHRNGVIDSGTHLSLHPGSSDLSEFELANLLDSLQQTIKLPLATATEDELLRSSIPRSVLLLVNVGIDPLKQHSQLNVHLATDQTDALNYSGAQDNLVQCIDRVTLNSWNEVQVKHYQGPNALLDCLRDHLDTLPVNAELPALSVKCFCRNRANTITKRVESLFIESQKHYRAARPSRFLLQIQHQYHVLELVPRQVRHVALKNRAALVDYLGQPQSQFVDLRLDSNALPRDDLRLILGSARTDCIQVFYRLFTQTQEAEISVLDEHNALWRQRCPLQSEQHLLIPLDRLLQSLLFRRSARGQLDPSTSPDELEVVYYQLLCNNNGMVTGVQRIELQRSTVSDPFYDIQAIIEPGAGKRLQVTLYCNHREFSALEYAEGLFVAVAREILAQRKADENYPCYISDIDYTAVDQQKPMQTVQALRYKTTLELALNKALSSPKLNAQPR